MTPRQRARLLRRNTRKVLRLQERHAGETVFVVGSGPQLNDLTPAEVDGLEPAPAIALNRVQHVVRARYFLSAYPAEVYMARRRLRRSTVLHMRRVYEAPLVPGTLTVRRVNYERGQGLSRQLDELVPSLRTRRNVALGASHLAFIMGARRIVYVGVEQRNALHFYDTRPAIRRDILTDLETIPDRDLCHHDHSNATYEALVDRLRIPPEILAEMPFYEVDHAGTFRAYFAVFASHGVEVFSTTPDSVVADAGAAYRPLADFL